MTDQSSFSSIESNIHHLVVGQTHHTPRVLDQVHQLQTRKKKAWVNLRKSIAVDIAAKITLYFKQNPYVTLSFYKIVSPEQGAFSVEVGFVRKGLEDDDPVTLLDGTPLRWFDQLPDHCTFEQWVATPLYLKSATAVFDLVSQVNAEAHKKNGNGFEEVKFKKLQSIFNTLGVSEHEVLRRYVRLVEKPSLDLTLASRSSSKPAFSGPR